MVSTAGSAPTVAFDVGALHGPITGVGRAVDGMYSALRSHVDVDLAPFVTSMRARVEPPTRRLPIPAALAHRWWRHRSPPVDRFLGRPDIVHGTNYVVPPSRCPRVVSVYDCWFLEHPDDASPAVRRAGDVLRRSVADGATVVTSSAATTDRVRDLFGTARVRTVLLGVPPMPSDGPLPAPGSPPYVLALGTQERRKNLPGLVAAFDRLAREHETVRLVLAGSDGDDSAAVAAAIAALSAPIRERIELAGRVGDAEKARLLTGARALAYPSLDEGFGFPILEAQQCGVPVVSTAVGSIPEVAGAAALLSPVHDVDALAANLHWVVTSDDKHDELRRRGLENIGRFSWDRTADELVALYTELSAER